MKRCKVITYKCRVYGLPDKLSNKVRLGSKEISKY